MNKILKIFKEDMKRLVKSRIALISIIGIAIIPGIYSWLNIGSNWNPYDNTGDLPIAVVNQDDGYMLVSKNINMGEMLEDSLKDNKDMRWVFTDFEDAMAGVNKSKYYGAVIIPEDFTAKVATIVSDTEIEKPKCIFYVNEKKNPIAPIIVSKAVSTIQTKLNESFVNAVVYKVIDEAESKDVVTKHAATTEDLIVNLNSAKKDIKNLQATLNTVVIASNSTINVLESLRELLPAVQDVSDATIDNINDVKDVVNSFESAFQNVNNNLLLIIEASKALSEGIQNILDKIDTKEDITAELQTIADMLDTLSKTLTELNDILDSIDSSISVPGLAQAKTKVGEALAQVKLLQGKVQIAIEKSKKNEQISQEAINEMKRITDELNQNLEAIQKDYEQNVLPSLNKAMKDSSKALTSAANLVSSLNTAIMKSDKALENLIKALGNNEELVKNINVLLQGMIEDIDAIIENLGGAEESEIYLRIVNLLKNSPEDVADFISTPVETEEVDVYKIEDYGSKMAPFYTVLACWVGCTLLVSLFKTDVKENRKIGKLKLYQEFFGRFMLFGIVAMLQGLIISVGDIILGVQVISHPLFILTCMISSLVFMLIIYSLVISFGKIGSAFAIIVMVFQVAGSGGTFPIELLPRSFQVLQPFMPFYPAMNALREIIGGFYEYEYIINIGLLLCHTILPLMLGLALRKPIKKLKGDVNKNLEETDLIV